MLHNLKHCPIPCSFLLFMIFLDKYFLSTCMHCESCVDDPFPAVNCISQIFETQNMAAQICSRPSLHTYMLTTYIQAYRLSLHTYTHTDPHTHIYPHYINTHTQNCIHTHTHIHTYISSFWFMTCCTNLEKLLSYIHAP
jgi:hypothetical protein